MAKSFGCDLAVIERCRSGARDLHLLVPFAGNQDDVTGTCFAQRKLNRGAAIGFGGVTSPRALESDRCIIDDSERVLAARVIGGQHNEITPFPRRLPHQWTLASVAVAAAAENRNRSE